MLSKLLSDLLQDVLKRRFRWFGYWLFISELAISLFFTVAALDNPVLALPYGIYAALTLYQMRRFAREKPQVASGPVIPFKASCTAALLTVLIFCGLIVGVILVADNLGI